MRNFVISALGSQHQNALFCFLEIIFERNLKISKLETTKRQRSPKRINIKKKLRIKTSASQLTHIKSKSTIEPLEYSTPFQRFPTSIESAVATKLLIVPLSKDKVQTEIDTTRP